MNMKTAFKDLLLLPMLTTVLGLMPAGPAAAQTFTTLHSFAAASGALGDYINGDGAYPQAGVILSGDTLYGTASQGGNWGSGTVFSVSTNGIGFATLHTFTEGLADAFGPPGAQTNSDGASPNGPLILSGSTL